MILSVVGQSHRTAVAAHLGAHLNAVVVDGALELCWNRTTRGPDAHDVLAGRATPIEAVRADSPVAILPCGRQWEATTHAERLAVLEAVEREYDTVLVDCPTTDPGLLAATQGTVLVTTPNRALSDLHHARAAEITAIALVSTATPIERLEQWAPVTPVPDVPTLPVSMAEAPPVERAFRSLAGSIHASMRS